MGHRAHNVPYLASVLAARCNAVLVDACDDRLAQCALQDLAARADGGQGGGGAGSGKRGAFPAGFGGGCFTDQPPRGSYQRSCEKIVWDCKTLSATCKTRAGAKVATSLAIEGCVLLPGDIANMDGVLHCNKGGPLPNGSYTQSCRDMWIAGGVLNAQCKDRGGNWNASKPLVVASCGKNGIDNIDGTLKCH